MHRYMLGKPAPFLKMAKKPLNPAIWQSIFQPECREELPESESEVDDDDLLLAEEEK